MSWKSMVDRFGPWRLRLPGRKRHHHSTEENLSPTQAPPGAASEAARQNRSFDQWCRKGRGREANQEL